MNMENNLLKLVNISYKVKNRELFRNLNLSVATGSFIAIAGKSGEGKSSLLYILSALAKANSGKYFFKQKALYSFWGGSFRRRNIGFLFQDFRLLPFLNVEQNIGLPLSFSGLPFGKKTIHQWMKDLNIFHLRKSLPHQISGGEAQRTALARALILQPKLLLLDEPSGNLDSETEKEIVKILLKLKEKKLTLVCVTHSNAIMQAADMVYHLKDKQLFLQKDLTNSEDNSQ